MPLRRSSAWGLLIATTLSIPCLSRSVNFAGGTGEPNDPYQIATVEQLVGIGCDVGLLGKHFVLVNDIDLDPNLPGGRVFTRAVIAPVKGGGQGDQEIAFTGSFNGNGHKLSHLTIRSGVTGSLGLFGEIGRGGRVHDLALEAAVISGASISDWCGGLASTNLGTTTNCSVTGTVAGGIDCGGLAAYNGGSIVGCHANVTLSGRMQVGGLVGLNGDGMITNCSVTGNISGCAEAYAIGGLVGESVAGAIANCYATARVTGTLEVGGLAGSVGGKSTIKNCYAGGTVSGQGVGLVGSLSESTVIHCYSTSRVAGSTFGGLISQNREGVVVQCFWDVEASGVASSNGGRGLTSAEMTDPEVYSLNGWGDDPNWVMPSEGGYPCLAWEGKAGQPIPVPVIDWFVGEGTAEAPYIIATADQLTAIGTASILWDKHFLLADDIDLDPNLLGGRVFGQAVIAPDRDITPGFQGEGFVGSFDGNRHRIKHLTVRGDTRTHLGLFGAIGARGKVSNLGLEDAHVDGLGHVSALVGLNQGMVVDCYASGRVSAGIGGQNIGGLAGENTGTISGCYGSVDVFGGKLSKCLGGLVGWNLSGQIEDCYATGRVSGQDGCENLGGLVGLSGGVIEIDRARFVWSGRITNSYASGAVSTGTHCGGLVGQHVGLEGSVTDPRKVPLFHCFFLASTDGGGPNNRLGRSLTKAQMKQQASFTNWDFASTWTICEGKDYPHLQWEKTDCTK